MVCEKPKHVGTYIALTKFLIFDGFNSVTIIVLAVDVNWCTSLSTIKKQI
jgi:hypothetical protein